MSGRWQAGEPRKRTAVVELIEPLQGGVLRIRRADAPGYTGLVLGARWWIVAPHGIRVHTDVDTPRALAAARQAMRLAAVAEGRWN